MQPNPQRQYQPKQDITIGNGLGNHRFSTNRSYTERALRALLISSKQIAMYFSTEKK